MDDVVLVRQRAYVKQHLLGRGGFGNVYLVKDKDEKDFYALKQIEIQDHHHAATIRKEFLAMIVSLNHRHIIHLFSCAISKSCNSQLVANFIMEYCEGGSLNDRLSKPSSQVVNLKWMIQISDAVSFLHYKQIIHRDLKPENILLGARENIKVCDLGLASITAEAISSDNLLSGPCGGPKYEPVGTPCYWSPKLYDGAEHRKESDVFALGHILYAIKERCFIDLPRGRLYGAFLKTKRFGMVSFGRAMKVIPSFRPLFSVDKTCIDRATRTIASAALAPDMSSRPSSEQIYQYLKVTARCLIENRKQELVKKLEKSKVATVTKV